MTKRTLVTTALIGLIHCVAGCDSRTTPTTPTAPSDPPTVTGPPPAPAPNNGLVTFADPNSSFSTSDLHDAEEKVIQISVAQELIWVADGKRLPGYPIGYRNSISVPGCACSLVVRFGSRQGERRAYLTADYIHDNPGTLVSLSISGGGLIITRTTIFAPGTQTLSGVITEASDVGPRPVEGATVSRLNEEQSGWQEATTDKNGFYEMKGLYDGERQVTVWKDGYDAVRSHVRIDGDTRFDFHITKR